jgi:hypothetical protein
LRFFSINISALQELLNMDMFCSEKRAKEKMLREQEDKKIVRAYEEQKSKGGLKYMSGSALGGSSIMGSSGVAGSSGALGDTMLDRDAMVSNHELDELWTSIRNWFDDLTEKGDKREFKKDDTPNKLQFTKHCQSLDLMDKGLMTEAQLRIAFSRSKYSPLPTPE